MTRNLLLLVLWTSFATILISLSMQSRVRLELIPAHNFPIQHFTDSADGGNSGVEKAKWSEGAVRMQFTLGNGFSFPYVGFHFSPAYAQPERVRTLEFYQSNAPELRCLDIRAMDSLEVEYRTFDSQEIHLQLGTWDPEISQPGNQESLRVLHSPLPAARDWHKQRLALEHLEIPQWWKNAHGVFALSRDKYLGEVCRLTFVAAGQARPQSDSIAIRSLQASGPNFPLRKLSIICTVGGYILLLLWAWRRRSLAITVRRASVLRDSLLRLRSTTSEETLPTSDWQRLLAFLVDNYRDPELSIEKVNQGTGFNAARIASLVKDNTGENFKGILNRLRMERAGELLRNTDMQVAQIAEHCGYTNPTHFARVFKAHTGQNPRDYRRLEES